MKLTNILGFSLFLSIDNLFICLVIEATFQFSLALKLVVFVKFIVMSEDIRPAPINKCFKG